MRPQCWGATDSVVADPANVGGIVILTQPTQAALQEERRMS
jgi:hypothetical protein